MTKRLFILFLISAFLLSQGKLYVSHALASEVVSLNALISEARKNNPEILAAKKRYEAAKARIPQAKSLEDPTVEVGFEKMRGSPFQFNTAMPEDRMLTVTQSFPFFGKLSLKGKIALVESQMAASEYKQKELDVVNEVKKAYYDLFINYKETELSRLSLEFLQGVTRISEAKYAVGVLTQEDVLKFHLELARINTDIINLEQEKRAKETRLNTLLNRDAENPLGIAKISEEVFSLPDIKSLYQSTVLNQPELIIFSYAIEKNKHAKSLAQRSIIPDVMSGIVMRGIASGGTIGPWDLMLAFSVPLWFWTKQRYEIKEAVANLEEAQVAYKAMENRAFSQVKDLAIKIEIAKNQISLYRDNLIPIIENSINSSLAAFRAGKGDMMVLLDSQRMLVETKIKYYQAVTEYNNNLVDLERAVGLDLKEVKK